MNDKYRESEQWKQINDSIIAAPEQIDLSTFRSGKVNSKISTWDPAANGVRYMKTAVYLAALAFDQRRWDLLDRVDNRLLGAPHVVHVNGRAICLDYLMAVDEAAFLDEHAGTITSVVEIGAGFGRTCHTLLSTLAGIDSYTIVDLPNCLGLSRRYLESVLPARQFAKIRFVLNTECDALPRDFDLAINIDSMAEMDEGVVDAYLEWIDGHCRAFYCKNPLGKYKADAAGAVVVDNSSLSAAMRSGKLREVVDMFDSQALAAQVPAFHRAYHPTDAWQVVASSPSVPWAFHHQALFRRG